MQASMTGREEQRTQEFVLRWSPDGGATYHDIARQQYNFNSHATREQEDYSVELDGVTVLELNIIPDISGGDARASLAEWCIAAQPQSLGDSTIKT